MKIYCKHNLQLTSRLKTSELNLRWFAPRWFPLVKLVWFEGFQDVLDICQLVRLVYQLVIQLNQLGQAVRPAKTNKRPHKKQIYFIYKLKLHPPQFVQNALICSIITVWFQVWFVCYIQALTFMNSEVAMIGQFHISFYISEKIAFSALERKLCILGVEAAC